LDALLWSGYAIGRDPLNGFNAFLLAADEKDSASTNAIPAGLSGNTRNHPFVSRLDGLSI
jgi:hypothetical protein